MASPTQPKFPNITRTLPSTTTLPSAVDPSKFPSPPSVANTIPPTTPSTFPSRLTSSPDYTSKSTSVFLSFSTSSTDFIPPASDLTSTWLPCLQCNLHGLRCSFTASWQLHFIPDRKTPPPPIPPEYAQCARCYRIGDIVCLRQKFVDENQGKQEEGTSDERKRVGFELIDATSEGEAEELIREKLWKDRWALPLGVGDKRRVRIEEMVKRRWGKVVDETRVEVEVSDAEEGSQEDMSNMVL